MPDTITVALDTNVFLQCKDLKELKKEDWAEITDANTIRALVPRTVVREVDKLKNDGREKRRSKRARAAYTLFAELALKEGGPSKIVRESNPKLEICLFPPADANRSRPSDLDLTYPDAKIVDETLAYQASHMNEDLRLITCDAGMALLGREHGLNVAIVPESWRLPPEKDETSKQLEELKRRLFALETREPVI